MGRATARSERRLRTASRTRHEACRPDTLRGSCWNTTGAPMPYLRDVMDPAKDVPLEGRLPAIPFFALPEYGLVFTDLPWNVKGGLIAAQHPILPSMPHDSTPPSRLEQHRPWRGTSCTRWRGFHDHHAPSATNPTNLLVTAPALCRRLGAALLKSPAYSLESRETPYACRTHRRRDQPLH